MMFSSLWCQDQESPPSVMELRVCAGDSPGPHSGARCHPPPWPPRRSSCHVWIYFLYWVLLAPAPTPEERLRDEAGSLTCAWLLVQTRSGEATDNSDIWCVNKNNVRVFTIPPSEFCALKIYHFSETFSLLFPPTCWNGCGCDFCNNVVCFCFNIRLAQILFPTWISPPCPSHRLTDLSFPHYCSWMSFSYLKFRNLTQGAGSLPPSARLCRLKSRLSM